MSLHQLWKFIFVAAIVFPGIYVHADAESQRQDRIAEERRAEARRADTLAEQRRLDRIAEDRKADERPDRHAYPREHEALPHRGRSHRDRPAAS